MKTHNVECDNCGTETPFNEIEKCDCPNCGNQILNYAGPTRGSAAEMLANEVAGADSEEHRDIFRSLLHFLACGLLDKHDITAFYYYSITDQMQRVLWEAVEKAEQPKHSDEEVLVCPSCEDTVEAWAYWFDPHDERGEFFGFEEEE